MSIFSKLPKQKSSRDKKFHLINIPRNWLNQGLVYMDRGEFWSRVAWEGLEIILLYSLICWITEGHLLFSSWLFLLSILTIHTLQWITNGNIWALILFAIPGLQNQGDQATCDYLNQMAERLRPNASIEGLAIFGSPTRGQWHRQSDVDLRIIRAPGFWNLLKSVALTRRERWLALIAHQPMDIFLSDGVTFLQKKLRKDERPIFLLKRAQALEDAYPGNSPLHLNSLTNTTTHAPK